MDIHFDPKAFDKFEGAIVPLVVYENGERKVVGKAKLASDDRGLTVEAKLNIEYADLVRDNSPLSFRPEEE
jgi:hypothetical protein